jgi:carbamoyl-phosphate synthase small subunit
VPKQKKMKVGHHGANHPVKDLTTGKVFITSQNHGFVVDEESVTDNIEITHRSLFDNSIQGLSHKISPAFGFQGHPEASPGPHDLSNIFNKFLSLIQSNDTTKSA